MIRGKLFEMRVLLSLFAAAIAIVSCGSSAPPDSPTERAPTTEPTSTTEPVEAASESGPGGYGFDRSDRVGGIANIMDAFATNEATAACIFDAWGDVANVPPGELTPELMTYEICGTSIFQMITGDPRFTGGSTDE